MTAVQNKSTDGSGSNQGAVAGNSASHQRPRRVQHNAEPQSGDRWIARGVNPRSGVRFSVKAPGGGRFATAAAAGSSGGVRGQRQRAGSRDAGMITSGSFNGRDSWRVKQDRSNHWRIAYASAKEVDSHLKLLAHAGAISQTAARDVMKAFDQVRAMTWRLLNPRS